MVCDNCGKPATMLWGEIPTCDACRPADGGEARPLVLTLPDLGGRITLSKAEAAAALTVSVDFLEKRVIPELRTIAKGGRVLVPVDELESWAERSKARRLKG